MEKKIIGGLGLLILSSLVSAETNDDWKLLVSPYMWGASLKGDLAIAGQRPSVNVPFSELANDASSVFMGNIELTNSRYGFYLDAVSVDTDSSDRVYGQKISYKIDQTTIAAGGFYRAISHELGGNTLFGEPRRLTVDPSIGARWTKLKAEVKTKSFGIHMAKKAEWTDPFIGLRLTADLTNQWNLLATTQISGFESNNKKTQAHELYLGYRTYLFSQPTILRVGYRSLNQRYTSKDFTGHQFKYDIRQAGPLVGLTMRF